jgi:flagellar protein FliO/FliZ
MGDTSTLDLVVRLVVSLGLVVGILLGAAWVLRRKGPLASGAGGIQVLARHALGRGSTLQVVRVGDRALVLGVTDEHVSLLASGDADEFDHLAGGRSAVDLRTTTTAVAPSRLGRGRTPGPGELSVPVSDAMPSGKGLIDALRERTVRR